MPRFVWNSGEDAVEFPIPRGTHALLASALVLLALSSASFAEDWPCWRGPRGNGTSLETGLPMKWGPTEGIAWKVEVPGIGHSSPIVAGDRVYLTTSTGPDDDQRWWIFAYDRSGKFLWKTRAAKGLAERAHRKHGNASSTPATDGEYVYAYFGNGGAACVDRDGKLLWQQALRRYSNPWGSAASVVLFQDLVLVNGDDDDDSFLAALDKTTGKIVWKTPRPQQPRSFSTPAVVPVPGTDRFEIVLSGHRRVQGYDPADGKLLWTVEGNTQWVTPTPAFADDRVFVSSGRSGPTFAIRPGGSGDVTRSHVDWKVPTGSPYISSPAVWDNYLFFVNGTGIAYCFEKTTGKSLWKQRLAVAAEGFSNSPVAAEGRFYVFGEDGTCWILEAGPEYKLLAKNELDERCLTSPAISDGQIFIRTDGHLFCIGERR